MMKRIADWLIMIRLRLACWLVGKHTLAVNLRLDHGGILMAATDHSLLSGVSITNAPEAAVSIRGWGAI